MSSGKDGLHTDNVGSSLYSKSQGKPVNIWGFFGGGRLEYYVLPEDVDGRGKKKTTNAREWRMCSFCKEKHKGAGKGCLRRKVNAHLRPKNWTGEDIDE